MELWVRSQDKKFFSKVNGIGIVGYSDRNECIIVSTNGTVLGRYESGTELGRYKNEERCLEIIDEFQNLLLSKATVSVFTGVSVPDNETERKAIEESIRNGIVYINSWDNTAKVEKYSADIIIFEMPKE